MSEFNVLLEENELQEVVIHRAVEGEDAPVLVSRWEGGNLR